MVVFVEDDRKSGDNLIAMMLFEWIVLLGMFDAGSNNTVEDIKGTNRSKRLGLLLLLSYQVKKSTNLSIPKCFI
jgi:hypothetical protein